MHKVATTDFRGEIADMIFYWYLTTFIIYNTRIVPIICNDTSAFEYFLTKRTLNTSLQNKKNQPLTRVFICPNVV